MIAYSYAEKYSNQVKKMKLVPRCYVCQINRIISEIELAHCSHEEKFEAIHKVLEFYDGQKDTNSAQVGTDVREIIAEITQDANPYKQIKTKENQFALSQLPPFRTRLSSLLTEYSAHNPSKVKEFRQYWLELIFRAAIIGNMMEYFMLEHSFEQQELLDYLDHEHFTLNDTKAVYEILKDAEQVLILTDNAGEIAFDRLMSEQLKELFPSLKIIVAVKESPVINDATMEDAMEVGLDEAVDQLMTTGTNSVGLLFDRTSEEFREIWGAVDLVIAKGMGHYETFIEDYSYLKCPLVHLLRVKCSSVAESVGVPRGKNVVKLVNPPN